jgi:hypothetical protein
MVDGTATEVEERKTGETSEPDEESSEESSEALDDDDDDDGSAYGESPEPAAAAARATTKPSRKAASGDAARPHVIGPIARCDLDSLSVVLSLLSSDDFLSAIRVNKQFYAARLKKSAWPALQLDSFIQSLRDDGYDNPARRGLRLRIPTRSVDEGENLLAGRASLLSSVTQVGWRFPGAHELSCATALRHLSSSHSLRSLSPRDIAGMLDSLLAAEPPSQLSAAHAALVNWNHPIHLTDLSCAGRVDADVLRRCSAIPTLTRLQAGWGVETRWSYKRNLPPPPALPLFARLQQLRLHLYDDTLLFHLTQCAQLRVLQILFCMSDAVRLECLCAIVSANATTLEELRFSCDIESSLEPAMVDGATDGEKWSVLSQCERLRVLELPLVGTLTPHLLHALAKAPVFQSLELRVPMLLWRYSPQLALLPSVLSSASSWCSVRIFLSAGSRAAAPLSSADDLTMMLSPASLTFRPPSNAALRRLRVFVRCTSQSTERCFVLRKSNSGGPLKCQSEY